MKLITKNSRFAKTLAIALSIVMLITTLNLSTIINVFALPNNTPFTITVTDVSGSAIEGATVTIAPVDESITIDNLTPVDTDSDGKAVFDSIYEYFAANSEVTELLATYTVTAENYQDVVIAEENAITVTAEGTVSVSMISSIINPTDINVVPYNGKYDGAEHAAVTANSAVTGDVITYSTDGAVYSDEVPQVKTPTTLTVYVKVERNGFQPFIQTYEAVVTNGVLTDSDIIVTPYVDVYDGEAHPAVSVEGATREEVSYSTDGGVVWQSEVPSVDIPIVDYEVTIKVSREYYDDYITSAKATVSPAEIQGITVNPYSGTYDKEEHAAIASIDGTRAGDIVEYSLTGNDDDYDVVCPKVEDANGEGLIVYVRIKRQYHNDYISFPTGFKAVVSKADFTVSATPYEGIYDGNEHDIISGSINGLEPGDTVTYSTERDGIYNSESIKVKNVADSDTYFIKVSRNDNYNDQIIEVKVEITPSEQQLSFGETPDRIYNEANTFKYAATTNASDADGDIDYEKVGGTANFTVAEDGTVTYTSVGTIKVKATISSCDNYKSAFKTYEITISYIPTPDWIIEGMNKYTATEMDWFSSSIFIKENDNDEKWYIVEDDNSLGQTDWEDSIQKDAEQIYDDVKVAFKNSAGDITDLVDVSKFAIDKTAPTIPNDGVSFKQKNGTTFANMLNTLSFGLFFNKTLEVTVLAEDFIDTNVNGSGVNKYALTFSNDNGVVYATSEQTSNIFKIDYDVLENFKGSVRITVRDNVENVYTYDITTDNSNIDKTTFMLENDAPVIKIITPGNESKLKENFAFEFTVDDVTGKQYSGVNSVKVTVNGTEVLFDDFSAEFNPDEVYSLIVDSSAKTVNGVALDEKWNKGKLEIKVNAYDNAGNPAVEKTSVAYFDQNSPIIKGFDFSLSNNIDVEKNTEEDIYKAVTVEDYGFYFKENITVTITAKDEIGANETKASGVKYITYKAVDIDGTVKYSGTNVEVDNSNSITFEIEKEKNFKGQIYAYATDSVGNTPNDCVTCTDDKVINNGDYKGYVHPNGSIVESLSKHEKTSNIVITAPEKIDTQNNSFEFNYKGECQIIDTVKDYDDTQKVPLYKSKDGIVFKVNVEDTYSGIRNVKWTVFEGEDGAVATEKTVTVDNNGYLAGDKEDWVIADETDSDNLVYNISGELLITGNHNNMVLLVELTDRAGNTSYDYYVFGIDTTLPTIDIQYNVDENEVNDDENTDYFRTNRKAEIIITERNFRAKNVVAVIAKDGKEVTILDLTKSDAWKEVVDTEDLDKTTYSAIVEYTSDGDYTFDIEFTDNAENSNKDVDYGESIAPTKFTVDKTLPTVAVEYDNNSAKNGNYYKADRTATITITEHNFDAKRVKILETTPTISAWKSEGDVHTATITYNTDGKYKLDIEFIDMAGNSIADFTAQEFYIDKTNPKVAISGIVDQSANNNDGNIGFSVTATDDNFDGFAPVLSAVVMIDGAFESKNLTIGNTEDITNGQKYTVTNIDTDGIYSITCTVVDKAGNAYSEVILEDANGKTYVEKRSGNDKLVTFSVNRNGSVFTLDSYTDDLVKTYYVKNVTENVTIIEINADPILENTVTLNGKTLVENTDYTVTLNNNAGSWYKYSYSLNKTLFDGESEYNIVVSSKDKATNEAFSDVKDVSVKFVVDRTAPIVTVAGLKTNGRYQVDKQVVTLVPSDDGGSLKSLIVRTVDENGKLIEELINLSGDELLEALANGNITFELGEGLYQNVQIICEDYAGNIIGAETDEIYSNVSISSSAFMIFWANKPLRWGSIAGVILLAAAIVFLVIFKKRKQER